MFFNILVIIELLLRLRNKKIAGMGENVSPMERKFFVIEAAAPLLKTYRKHCPNVAGGADLRF